MKIELVQTTTQDGIRLDGSFQSGSCAREPGFPFDAICLVHGAGGSFYTSTLFDTLAEHFLKRSCSVLRINTRGHDGISTASTLKGGRRFGAAYEVVDDCRHDLAAWIDWLHTHGCREIGLVGHSLGAVKCLYALAHDRQLRVNRVVAISPPRLSYSWFSRSPEGPQFLQAYAQARRHVEIGENGALLDMTLPMSMPIAAGCYVEKYGPDERYNYLKFLANVNCPTLITLGALEVENNMAFRGVADALTEIDNVSGHLTVETIDGADHFYTGVRADLLARIDRWILTKIS